MPLKENRWGQLVPCTERRSLYTKNDNGPEMRKDNSLLGGAGSEDDVERIKLTKEEKKKLEKKIQSFKPIRLNVGNREIVAEFDKFCAKKNIYAKGNSSNLGYNFKIENIDKIPQFISESKFKKSKIETGKNKPQHKDVIVWHYFKNKIKTEKRTFDMIVNIRDKGFKQYVYEILIKEKKI